jgi:hypothetical protein
MDVAVGAAGGEGEGVEGGGLGHGPEPSRTTKGTQAGNRRCRLAFSPLDPSSNARRQPLP